MAIPPEHRPLRINMVELLRQPGAERTSDATVDPVALDCVIAEGQSQPAGLVEVAVRAVAGTDDVEVHCHVSIPWAGDCRRCLIPVSGTERVEIVERYRPAGSGHVAGSREDAEVIAVEGDQIDLVPVVRETIMIELPVAPLCSPECAGICPLCGVDRNSAPCECSTEVRDDRWAALDQLRLDD